MQAAARGGALGGAGGAAESGALDSAGKHLWAMTRCCTEQPRPVAGCWQQSNRVHALGDSEGATVCDALGEADGTADGVT
jgi:hypothetical protein